MRTIYEYPEINPFNDKTDGRVIAWWSGGVASAVACLLSLERWGDNCELVFCDTGIEHPDTYRFMNEYERVVGVNIKRIKSPRFNEPEEVWRYYKGMNFATGAPCSTMLKREPRLKYQDLQNDFCQIFGFDYGKKEMRRATNMLVNNPDLNPVFPLIVERYDRKSIFETIAKLGIEAPKVYKHFLNNNCIGGDDSPIGGCVQGGIGYWQKIKDLYPKKFDYMANIEHEISRDKGEPVTICRDQRKATRGNRLFLKPCADFPNVGTIDEIKGRRPLTPFECNGFCSTEEV
jgi:hypothetical protein